MDGKSQFCNRCILYTNLKFMREGNEAITKLGEGNEVFHTTG